MDEESVIMSEWELCKGKKGGGGGGVTDFKQEVGKGGANKRSQAQRGHEIMRGKTGSENNKQERRREERRRRQVCEGRSRWQSERGTERKPKDLCSAWAEITETGSPSLPWQAETRAHMQRHRAHGLKLNTSTLMTQKQSVSLIKSTNLCEIFMSFFSFHQATTNTLLQSFKA